MRPVLWTGDVLADLLGAPASGTWEARGASIDTRTLRAGDLFVALPGRRDDGHAHLDAAFRAGAVAALVRASRDGPACGPRVRVDDVQDALDVMARASRARRAGHVLAVTGSVGKTGVKEALHAALGASGPTHASESSYNNRLGVSLSLARMPTDGAYAVFEIGMNRTGEVACLGGMVRPHTAIVTRIGQAHVGRFPDLRAVAEAKAEIFSTLVPGGTAVIPANGPCSDVLESAARNGVAGRTWRFGIEKSPTTDAYVRSMRLLEDRSLVSASVDGHDLAYEVGVPGVHHVANSLAVLLAVRAAGGDPVRAAAALADVVPLRGRGARRRAGTVTLVDESYNANPTSVRAALHALGLTPRRGGSRRIAVLGDMAELGDAAEDLHGDLIADVVSADVDLVLTCGPLMRRLHDRLPSERAGLHADDPEDLAPFLAADVRCGDVVMIKGSRSSGMERLVDRLTESLPHASGTSVRADVRSDAGRRG